MSCLRSAKVRIDGLDRIPDAVLAGLRNRRRLQVKLVAIQIQVLQFRAFLLNLGQNGLVFLLELLELIRHVFLLSKRLLNEVDTLHCSAPLIRRELRRHSERYTSAAVQYNLWAPRRERMLGPPCETTGSMQLATSNATSSAARAPAPHRQSAFGILERYAGASEHRGHRQRHEHHLPGDV